MQDLSFNLQPAVNFVKANTVSGGVAHFFYLRTTTNSRVLRRMSTALVFFAAIDGKFSAWDQG